MGNDRLAALAVKEFLGVLNLFKRLIVVDIVGLPPLPTTTANFTSISGGHPGPIRKWSFLAYFDPKSDFSPNNVIFLGVFNLKKINPLKFC